jgi:photosystem II stability/assembly factor-like uncharacterized protein
MKANFGAIVVAGIGKLGGQVFSRSNAGTVLKRKMSPVNRASQSQLNVRSRMSIISSTWRSLSESQRLLWNAFTSSHPITNDFGQTTYLSGFGQFCKVNANRASLGYSILNVPSESTSLYVIERVGILTLSTSQLVLLAITPALPINKSIKVYASIATAPGISKFYGVYNLLGSIDSTWPYPADVSPLYLSKFGAIGAIGYKIFFKFIVIDQISGIGSSPLETFCIISNLNYSNVGLNWSNLGQQAGELAMYHIDSNKAGIAICGTGANGKILQSSDYGANWSDLGQQFSESRINATQFLINAKFIAGTAKGTFGLGSLVLESYTNGKTWSNEGVVWDAMRIVTFLDLGGGIVLAGTDNHAYILRSTDFGRTWSNLGQQAGQTSIVSFANMGNGIVLAGTSKASGGGHILRSTDNGLTFSDLGQQFSQTGVLALCNLGNGICLAGTYPNAYIIRTTDWGATWANIGAQYAQNWIAAICSLGNNVIVAGTYKSSGGGHIIRSTDGGLNWSDLGQQYSQSYVYCLHYAFNGVVLAGTLPNGYILRSAI